MYNSFKRHFLLILWLFDLFAVHLILVQGDILHHFSLWFYYSCDSADNPTFVNLNIKGIQS